MLVLEVSQDPLTESNCYLLAEAAEAGSCVVIDPGESENLFRILEERQWEPELLLLTHEHCDHMAGMDALRRRYPRARFLATAACNAGMQDPRLNMSRIMEVYLYFRGKPGVHYEPFACRAADGIIPDDAVLSWRGHTLRFVPLPGHTPGSEGIFLDEKVFFSGDYLIQDEEPILRFPGGDEEIYARVTEPYLQSLSAGIKICPGHRGSYVMGQTGGNR